MKLLLSCLQLASLWALSSYSVSSQLVVTQSEDVTLTEGETAEIFCCWSGEHERITVFWSKKQNEVKHEVVNNKSCSVLNISNITVESSGTYVCRVSVDIPFPYEGLGNGTVLTVKSKSETQEDKGENGDLNNKNDKVPPVVIGLSVIAPILLLTLICFCVLRRRKRDQALRVIYEVPHFDSETQEEMEKNSTGSRGSSQWCQVPVYESFDYFEHVEVKKSG